MKHQFLNIYDRKAKIQGTFQVYQIGEDRATCGGMTTGRSQNQIKVERTHAFNHFPSVVYYFRMPHTTPRTIPDR